MKKTPTAVIFTGGHYDEHEDAKDFYLNIANQGNVLICADSGANYIYKLGLQPLVIVGDMDSISKEVKEAFKEVEQVKYRPDKDYTDTEIAIEKAREYGYKNIYICGGIGSRFDHSLANVMMLKKLNNEGCFTTIINYYQEIFFHRNGCCISNKNGWTASLLSISELVEDVVLDGFQFPITNENIIQGVSRTVSNVITSDVASIHIKSGDLLVVLTRSNGLD
ncbi:Thiamine pyrophosphokinase [Entamoeba marina]